MNKFFTQLFMLIPRILIRAKERYESKSLNGWYFDGGGLLIIVTNKCKVVKNVRYMVVIPLDSSDDRFGLPYSFIPLRHSNPYIPI